MTAQRVPDDRILRWTLVALVCAVMVWSWIEPRERGTWWLESFPIFLAAPVLYLTASRFPLTRLAYLLIAVHACILLVGAHYTYEHVPLFNWARDQFHLKRNDYDRLGHVAQGFIPAVIAREIYIRQRVVKSRGWLIFIVLCTCLAISATYELVEWTAAEVMGSGADAFLGTQGDPFDTDWDMFSALCGASLSLLLMPWLHDREIARIEQTF